MQKGIGSKKVVDPSQKGKKRSKSSNRETTLSQAKKRLTSTEELVLTPIHAIQTFELVENPSLTTLYHRTPALVPSSQLTPPSTTRYLRRAKCVINDLNTDIESTNLYRGMALDGVYHYIDNLPYMVHER